MGALFSFVALRTHVPAIIFWILMLLNFACFFVGLYFTPEQQRRSAGHKEPSAAEEAAAATTGSAAVAPAPTPSSSPDIELVDLASPSASAPDLESALELATPPSSPGATVAAGVPAVSSFLLPRTQHAEEKDDSAPSAGSTKRAPAFWHGQSQQRVLYAPLLLQQENK